MAGQGGVGACSLVGLRRRVIMDPGAEKEHATEWLVGFERWLRQLGGRLVPNPTLPGLS